jgi:thiol:disulfide interchange protein
VTTLRRLLSPADAFTWVGRVLGLVLLAFVTWVLWQLAPMLVGDAIDVVNGILRGGM